MFGRDRGFGGGLVVTMLALNSENLSSYTIEAYSFHSVVELFKRN